MADVILSLGTNLGDRAAYMRSMERELEKILRAPISASTLFETQPLGVTADHPWYYNRLVSGTFEGTPYQLLAFCQAIESRLGRTRPEKYAPRTADIDIILFEEVLLSDTRLTIPHPHVTDRRFLLEGLLELAPEREVPGTGTTVREMVRRMDKEIAMQQMRPVEPEQTERHGTT